MIKRVLFLTPVFTLFILLLSCEDSLKLLPPDGQVKDEYWKTEEDVRATLMGAYQRIAQLDEQLFYYGELRGDLLEAGVNLSNQYRDIMESNIFPTNNISDWKPFYTAINYCNLVLKYSPEVKELDDTFSDYMFNVYNAEAIFLRSLSYFYLVRIFNDVPFIMNAYDSDNQDFFPSKTESSVILDTLIIHLNGILTAIPEEFETNDKTRGRATRAAVNALLADIALWQFNYEDCISYVERIEVSDLYQLVPGDEWFTIFSEGNTFEGIFELQFDGTLGQNNNMYNVTRTQSNNFLASPFIMDLFSAPGSVEIVRGSGSVTKNKLIWKYVGQQADGISLRSGANSYSGNWIVYRLADVLLMKAEALSQIDKYDEALALVNEIRERAYVTPLASYQQTPQAFEDLILEERAKELAFEGKRWFDLLRMGRRNNFERKSRLIEVIISNTPATQKRVMASKLNDPNGWYLPIYEQELENNLNMVQNPYYN